MLPCSSLMLKMHWPVKKNKTLPILCLNHNLFIEPYSAWKKWLCKYSQYKEKISTDTMDKYTNIVVQNKKQTIAYWPILFLTLSSWSENHCALPIMKTVEQKTSMYCMCVERSISRQGPHNRLSDTLRSRYASICKEYNLN